VLFGQLVDDPSSWPERFPTEQAQEKERKRLFKLIEQLVLWENTTNELVLNAARFEIARSVAWNREEEPPAKANPEAVLAYLQEYAPPVYDPFCGGGSIPLEAQRLGLRAYGSDLNPVAVLISKALVEIPPKFAGQPPVNPARDPHKRWKGAQGLAEDVRHYGQWMRDEAEKRIGHFYPQVEVTEQAVHEQPSLEPLKGQKLTVIAWLWARTVASPNPACNGAHVPLVHSFDLSTKKDKRVWVEPIIDQTNNNYRFEVRTGVGKTPEGTVKRDGAVCLLSRAPIPLSYVRSEARAGRMGTRLLAVVAERIRGKLYLRPPLDMQEIVSSSLPENLPETNLPAKALGFRVQAYGLTKHRHLFTDRQLLALTTFSDLVQEVRERILGDAQSAGLVADKRRFADGGTGADAYADAMSVFLAFAVDNLADRSSVLTGWVSARDHARNTFARQALSMAWDFAETNPFCDASGNFAGGFKKISDALEFLGMGHPGQIDMADAISSSREYKESVISTDPPYYDNIGYADLSDYFYVWMRRSLGPIFPKLFGTLLVPKAEELVAEPHRHHGKKNAEEFFLEGMTDAIHRMAKESNARFPATIYYAFKQSEVDAEGIASTGWATFLEAVGRSGFAVVGTWPVRTERSARSRGIGSNALASSIVLVCRKRPAAAPVTTRAEFLRFLKRELPEALKLLQHGSIAPVDMAQASVGPGMAIFTRYAKVLESDDSAMTVKTALQLINQALDEYLSEQEGDYDADTRFAITWFETYGMEVGPYGTAETLATARGVAVSGVEKAGVLESHGNVVRLLRRDEMPGDWDPETDKRLTVWECTQHLIRTLESEGELSAAKLLLKMAEQGEAPRDLAYRLYGICERKSWAEEGRAYNGLVVAWPELVNLGRTPSDDLFD
jgi:putative DNA methylase